MSRLGNFLILILGLFCLALTLSLILVANGNQRLQARIQGQQQALAGGLLGTQGRQIAMSVVQDMTLAAATNPLLRDLLVRHGYPVPVLETPKPPAPVQVPPSIPVEVKP